jgi:N,N'-diacetyllegionaminate synthase
VSVYIIAEIGSGHGGSLDKAKQLIEIAAKSGANAVKFQLFRASSLAERRGLTLQQVAPMKPLELPEIWLPELKARSSELNLDFMCTAFDIWGLQRVAEYVQYFKIASFEMSDPILLQAHGDYEQSVILSTGMATRAEVIEAASNIEHLQAALHCTTAYPAPIDEINLRAMADMGVNCDMGLSDHSGSPLTGAVATALGARWLEVHLRAFEGNSPDDGLHALMPDAFAQMVEHVRQAELMLGSGSKGIQHSEVANVGFRVG